MTTLTIPSELVRFYNDGLEFATTPILVEAEQAYRSQFAEAASIVATWHDGPDYWAIEAAWEARRKARSSAERLVPSAELYGQPEMESEQVLYCSDHEIAAASARGRVQAFEIAVQDWEHLENEGVPTEVIGRLVMKPWSDRVRLWSRREIDSTTIELPPMPIATIPFLNRKQLEQYKEAAKAERLAAKAELHLPTKTVRQLINEHPDLRRPVIHGLLREGETMNVIASPKVGKSWLVIDLALAVATGRPWLGSFETERGDVLIIDNELHRETSAHRIPKVMQARGIDLDLAADNIHVANVRGDLKDIFSLSAVFQQLQPGRFKLIVLDAFYRFMPKDSDENDNGTMSQVYNHLDAFAARLGCSFVLVHHSSKGNQSGKSVTDVGAGAGSQSRATDTHLILRPHELDDVVVLDAAVRSWPPIGPRCLRWLFPVWEPDDLLDPMALRPERQRRKTKAESAPAMHSIVDWTPRKFVDEFVGGEPKTIKSIIAAAKLAGVSQRLAKEQLQLAEDAGLIYRWSYGANRPVKFATQSQPESKPIGV
jgi:hypothetical protein